MSRNKLKALQRLVDVQADNEGLWFDAERATEAYLQQSLRRLHNAVESDDLQQIESIIDAEIEAAP